MGQYDFRRSWQARTMSVLCSATMVFGLTPITAIAQPADPSGGGSQPVAGEEAATAVGGGEGLAAQDAQPGQEEGAGQAAPSSDDEQVVVAATPAPDEESATAGADASDAAITTTNLPAARVGRAYSATVASNIQGATFAATGLPDGLSMAEDGTISGTPTAASDAANITVTATADGTTATAQLTLKVRAAVTEVNASWSWNMGSTTAGVAKVSNAATATTGRINSTFTTPPMPPTFRPRSLRVTSIGDGAFSGCAKLRTLVIPSSVTTIADNAFDGCDQLAIQCDEGSAADTFAKAHGIPVRYADLDDATAEVSDLVFELPELAQIGDADRPAIEEARAAYDALTAEQKSQINAEKHLAACEAALANCDKEPVITTESLEDGVWGDDYSAQLAFTGPYAVTWGLAEGSELPAGLLLDASTGVISGRAPAPGTYAFTVTATSSAGKVGTKEYTLAIDHPAAEAAELTFTVADGAATVSGVTNKDTATSAQIPATYESEGVTYPVTAIGEDAFNNCGRLESVSIPEGVASIGKNAFRSDHHLQGVDLPDTVTSIDEGAFWASGVKQVSIPTSVKSIGKEAFYATDLESLVIPEGVESVGDSAFRNCEHLRSVSLPSTLDLLRQRSVSAGNYVSYLYYGNNMFRGCTSLEEVTFAEGFGQAVSSYMFDGCSSLKTVTVPGTVKAIGTYAFRGCDSLESVVIENGVEGIDDGAFQYCPVLKTVSIPSSVTVIHGASGDSGGMGFIITGSPNAVILCAAGTEAENCAILNNLPYQLVESPRIDAEPVYLVSDGAATITGTSNARNFTVAELAATTPDGTPVKAIGARAFYWERMLTRASVPEGVEDVGQQAFANCTHLTQVSLPSTLSSLGWAAFSGDTRLAEVSFAPNSALAAIAPYTFYNCAALEQVDLPEGVTSIGKDAFAGCAALKAVTIPDSVTEIADDAFTDCPNVVIRCSEGSAAEKFAQEHGIAIDTPVVSRLGGATAADTAASIAAHAFEGQTADTVVVARDDDYHDALAGAGLAGALDAPILLTDSGELSQACADEIKALGAKKAVILGGESAVSPRVAGQLAGLGIAVDRVAGDDVYGTSKAITKALIATGQASSEYAIAVNPTTFADAVSISGWAYANKVPVMLQTWGDTADQRGYDDEAREILSGREVIACGGTGAVSDESLAGVGAANVIRLGGDTIYDTSRAIADWELQHGMSASDVTVASAIPDYQGVDALAASALAGRAGGVTLLAQANEAFGWHDGGETALGFITDHAPEVSKVHVLGGEAASPKAFYASVQAVFGED